MQQPLRSTTSTIDIYIKLAQYPILADQIRERMRQELFQRGVVSEEEFEKEVEEMAVESQRREGIHDPYRSEPAAVWHKRKARIRAFHTDFYFGYNLHDNLFEEIVAEVLEEQPDTTEAPDLAFNPELAPWSLLFRQGIMYEELPPAERQQVSHHLEEIKVVLIKGMISDQLPFIGVAKKVFTIQDLQEIYERRIGGGKIGGKAAGMYLAWKILERCRDEHDADLSQKVTIPDSYFVGTDVLYEFHRLNNLEQFMNQKYRLLEEIRADYDRICAAHLRGKFPPEVLEGLDQMLAEFGNTPLIVRSSSLLEDNFGYAFAGKYQSHFCPNQGTPAENRECVLNAIRRIYASALHPDALLYRRRHNLLDYDERMAILIQPVIGHRHGRYFFPTVAGVGYSKNPFRWNAKIRREDGFLRLVWGVGTRAVDRVSDDYPRMIALSHPTLRPETSARAISQYSQHYVDLIDLEANEWTTLPVRDVLAQDYPYLRYIASERREDYVQRVLSTASLDDTSNLILTFDTLVQDNKFINMMRHALARLERVYQTPVDIEFTVEITPDYPQPDYCLNLLQCRPLTERIAGETVSIPEGIPEADVVFRTYELIPDGRVEGIRYLIFVDPLTYRQIRETTTRLELGRAIGRLNKRLENERFVLIGPGRWGSANLDLGVRVTYADIFNTQALIEMSVAGIDGIPELSYGTHFFQDLIEGGIYSLPLHLESPDSHFNWDFFEKSQNVLDGLSPQDATLHEHLKVIDVEKEAPGKRLLILMDGRNDKAVAYLEEGKWPPPAPPESPSILQGNTLAPDEVA